MKILLKPVLWTKDKDKDGLCPIAIRITGGGKHTYYNTGIKAPETHWQDGIILKGATNADIKNNRLSKLIKDAEREILLREDEMTLELAKRLFRAEPTKGQSFYIFAEKVIAEKNASTKRRYTVEVSKLKEYAGNALSFNQITPKWLSAYHKHLLIKNNPNTAINAFKVIRHVFSEARDANVTNLNPFAEWKYPQYKAPKRGYLTLAECDKLFALLDKKINKDIELVTAFFLLEIYSGIRVSDWGKFSVEKLVRNNDMIFTTTKTGTEVRLPLDLMPSLNRIVMYIQDNKLRFDKDGAFANDMLKAIAPLAGIEKKLTTHLARHTFATQCLSIGMSHSAISTAMGITLRQVGTYAKVMPDNLRTELKRLGGGV